MHNVTFHACTAYQIQEVSKNSGKIGEERGMHGSECDLEEIIDWETWRKEASLKACVNMGG
jgi:hypothetical protein